MKLISHRTFFKKIICLLTSLRAISQATNIVEHPGLVAQRLVRLAKIVGRENVMAGTDCGFAQSPFAQRVHPSIMWAKLEALAEGAQIASKELWRGPSRSAA